MNSSRLLRNLAPGRLVGIRLAAAVFAAFFVFRLGTASILNDDYLHLSTAQQVVLGAVPVRDFIDPGELFFYGTSAVAQVVLGRNLFSEVLLDIVCLSAGHLLVFMLASRAARSYLVGLVASATTAILVTRLYSYPKTLLYAAALALMWRYVDRPTRPYVHALGLCTGVAFLFRHDHGAYIGVTGGVVLVLVHWQDRRELVDRLLRFACAVAVLLVPFFVFLQINGGILQDWRNTLATAHGEYLRTAGHLTPLNFTWTEGALVGPGAKSWLGHVTVLLPPLALLVLAVDAMRAGQEQHGRWVWRGMPHESVKILATVVLALFMHQFLLRARSDSAIADVSAITGVLAAWLTARGLAPGLAAVRGLWSKAPRASPRGVSRLVSFATLTLTLAVIGITAHYLPDTEGGNAARAFAVQFQSRLTSLGERVSAFRRTSAPFDDEGARYVFNCTREGDRVLITSGYAPELYYAIGRGFAAGRLYYLRSLAPSPEFIAYSFDRLQAEHVPIVLFSTDRSEDFVEGFPAIDRYVMTNYRDAGGLTLLGRPFRVMVDTRVQPVTTFGSEALPCFGAP